MQKYQNIILSIVEKITLSNLAEKAAADRYSIEETE